MAPSLRNRRTAMWLLLASCYVFVSLYRLKTGVLAEELAREFEATATEIGSLHAVFFVIYAPLQLVAGVLADRYGPRLTVSAGAVVMHVGGVVFALSTALPVAFVGRLLMGIGASVVFISVLKFCANWFRPQEFATMSGLTASVSGLGGVIATYPLAVAASAVGWRVAVGSLAVVGIGLGVLVFVFVRNKPEDPGDFGVPEVEPVSSFSEVRTNLGDVIGARQTWLIAGGFFVATGINTTVLGLWGVPFLVQIYGLSVPDAAVITLLGSAGLTTGPPAIGRLSDAIGVRVPLMVIASFAFTASYATVAVLGDPPLAVVTVAFFSASFLIGGFVLGFTVMRESHSTSASGTATGAVNAAGFTGAAVFPTVMGALLDAYWTGETVAGARVYTLTGYRAGFGVAAAAGVFAFLLTVVLYYRGESPEKSGAEVVEDDGEGGDA